MISLKHSLFLFNIFGLVVLTLGRHSLKIIEGEDADIKDFPYMAAYTFLDGKQLKCGSSIINENTVLTAAHCVYGVNTSEVTITYGNSKFYEGSKTYISKSFIHENFSYTIPPYTDDIAVLKVDPPIVFGDTVQPVKLAQKNAPNPEGKVAKFTGWGRSSEFIAFSIILQKVNLTIIGNKTCEDIWKDTDNPVDSEKEICAQSDMSDGKPRGPCNGDSGSPLVIDGVQYGLTSNNRGCGNAKYPVIYTRVAHYIDWLSDKL